MFNPTSFFLYFTFVDERLSDAGRVLKNTLFYLRVRSFYFYKMARITEKFLLNWFSNSHRNSLG